MRGKIVAAGVSVAVGSTLVGFMAAGDHSADASQTNPSSVSATGDAGNSGGATATPTDGRTSDNGFGNDGFGSSSDDNGGSVSPQPQTRTGGS